jgi:hypothetical protein
MKTMGLLALLCTVVLAGCGVQGSSSGCTTTLVVDVQPYPEAPSTPPDHTLAPPGNQEQFIAFEGFTAPAGCAVPALLVYYPAVWTVSDPASVQLSASTGGTVPAEIATCIAATPNPVTITASVTNRGVTTTGTHTMTCN